MAATVPFPFPSRSPAPAPAPAPARTWAWRSLQVLFLGLIPPSCASYEASEYVGESSYQLTETVAPDGGVVSYHLRVKSSGSAQLDIITVRDRPHTEIGVNVVEIDKVRAQQLRLDPFSGLLVQAVESDSPAASAGIRPGDVLVSVGGERVIYYKALTRVMAALPASESTVVEVLRDGKTESIQIVPAIRMRREQELDSVQLERPKDKNPRPYMGVTLRTFPSGFAKRVFGHDRPVVVITGVGLGSPAYLAGLRAGDIILRVNGAPAPDAEGLLELVRRRGPLGEVLELEVRSKYGEYATTVALDDYTGVARTYLPLIWGTRVSARSTEWDILLGGWVAGYENHYIATRTRSPAEHGYYSMLMGLFRHDWGPSGSRTRLLWFISFR